MLESARCRAKKRGLDFNLTIEDVVIPAVCPILGIEIKRKDGRGGREFSPSLDRIIPSLGYIKGNTAVISYRANRIKNDGTAEEHEKIAAWIRAHAATI